MKIIILHGLYMNGLFMVPLSERLKKAGYDTQIITYNTVSIKDEKVFSAIDTALDSKEKNILVGHSLGGLMIKNYLAARKPDLSVVSHVVTIGSPLQGASIAKKIQSMGLGKILGNSPQHGLNRNGDSWSFPQLLGSIAGTLAIGMRPLLCGHDKPSDGIVTIEETMLEGMTDHLLTKQTHTGMIYSAYIADQIDFFINHHHFAKDQSADGSSL